MSAEPKDVVVSEQQGFLAMIERVAASPDIPVDKLERLLEMQIRIRSIEAEQEYSAAMARVQAKAPVVIKDAYNDQTSSPYATVSAIAAAIKPIYTTEGFSLSFSEAKAEKPDHIRVRCTVRHRAGHKDETPYTEVAIDKAGIKGNDNKTMTHAEGSSFTYGRRYLTCMVFDVATGLDNDGNGQGGAAVITTDQATVIQDKLNESGANVPTFLNWLKVDTVEQIKAKDYERAIDQLDKKIARKAK